MVYALWVVQDMQGSTAMAHGLLVASNAADSVTSGKAASCHTHLSTATLRTHLY